MTKFVKLDESLLSGDVWGFLKPGPRCLYIELKREFNGSNNGKIFLSHRDAAYRLGTHRNTVGPWFKALEQVGLIEKTGESKVGPSGIGVAATWLLLELPAPIPEKPEKKRVKSRSKPPKFVPPQAAADQGDDSIIDDEVVF